MSEDSTAGTYEVVVDQDICMAAGYCYGSHPELFGEGKLGISELISGDPPASAGGGPVELTTADMLEKARQASQVCPSGAISVIPTTKAEGE